ncbi:hypothetical protein HMP09_2372 [Sphingomonas sp. HMP9]|uniref:hypothetical protein n=1 Tax=Sphingomonas sp. HMP9 TaxID=1517554 RepID=UPI0015967B81|nr:hypothetical protein [Sphingomonas sp. HMP9]BCA63138.1 hypothetical protein HMP09_2372 [Sphingomonas sp. HMP9]
MATALLGPRTVAANTSSRRSVLGFIGVLGIVAAVPAITVASMPPAPADVFARYLAADTALNTLHEDAEFTNPAEFDRVEDAYLAALSDCRNATPRTIREFAIWFQAVNDDSPLSKQALGFLTDIAASEGR